MSTKKKMNDGGADAMPSMAMIDAVGDIGGGPALIAILRDCVAHLTSRAWEFGAKACKLAERNQWAAVLDMVVAGNKAEHDAATYLKIARELAERAARQRSALLKKTHGAKAATPGAEALKRLNASVAECARLAESVERVAEPCGILPVLEGMARMRLRRPMSRKAVDAKRPTVQRAKGQRGPRATAKDYVPQLMARTIVQIETGKGFACVSDEQASARIRSGKFRRATAEEVAENAEWMAIEKRPVRVPSAGKAVPA